MKVPGLSTHTRSDVMQNTSVWNATVATVAPSRPFTSACTDLETVSATVSLVKTNTHSCYLILYYLPPITPDARRSLPLT